MKATFDNADKDQDGLLNLSEFVDFMEENNKIRNNGDNTNFT